MLRSQPLSVQARAQSGQPIHAWRLCAGASSLHAFGALVRAQTHNFRNRFRNQPEVALTRDIRKYISVGARESSRSAERIAPWTLSIDASPRSTQPHVSPPYATLPLSPLPSYSRLHSHIHTLKWIKTLFLTRSSLIAIQILALCDRTAPWFYVIKVQNLQPVLCSNIYSRSHLSHLPCHVPYIFIFVIQIKIYCHHLVTSRKGTSFCFSFHFSSYFILHPTPLQTTVEKRWLSVLKSFRQNSHFQYSYNWL